VLWDTKGQKGKREKGKGEGKMASKDMLRSGYLFVAVQCLQCRLSPFGVVRQKRGDVDPMKPPSA
jgi:hypothetical protein